MVTRKGAVLTIGILGAITAASFIIWIVPQTEPMSFVVSDFRAYLDGVENVRDAIIGDLDAKFQAMTLGEISPDEYVEMAESAITQINTQIVGVIDSDPPREWEASYTVYIDALRQTNSYILETIVAAETVGSGTGPDDAIKRVGEKNEAMLDLIVASYDARP